MSAVREAISYMDRRVTESSPGVSVLYAFGATTWTLPYNVAVDGTEGDLRIALRDAGQLVPAGPVFRPAANKIAVSGLDYTLRPVYIGVLYPFTYVPTPLYMRDKQGEPDLTGKLLLHRLTVLFSETTDISATVRRTGRSKQVISKAMTRAQSGELHVPVHAKNTDTRIEITSTSPGARALTGLVWQGEWQTRYRRV